MPAVGRATETGNESWAFFDGRASATDLVEPANFLRAVRDSGVQGHRFAIAERGQLEPCRSLVRRDRDYGQFEQLVLARELDSIDSLPLLQTLIDSGPHEVTEANDGPEEHRKQVPTDTFMWVDSVGGAKPNETCQDAGRNAPPGRMFARPWSKVLPPVPNTCHCSTLSIPDARSSLNT